MTLCANCGTTYEENTKFCTNCGMNMEVKEIKEESNIAENLGDMVKPSIIEESNDLEESNEEAKEISMQEDNDSKKSKSENSYIFKKLDEDINKTGISFKKLDENAVYEPFDRIAPIKEAVRSYIDKAKQQINKGKLFVSNKLSYINQLSPEKRSTIKKRAVIGALLVVISTVSIQAYIKSEGRTFSVAARYEKQGEYLKAAEMYELILEKNPDNLIVKEQLGLIYLEHLKNLNLAEKYLRDVLLNSDDPNIKSRLNHIFPTVTANPGEDDTVYTDLINVELDVTDQNAKILYYVINGHGQTPFKEYKGSISLSDGENTIVAKGVSSYGLESEVVKFSFKVDLEDKFVMLDNMNFASEIKKFLGKSEYDELKQSDIDSINSMQIVGDRIFINVDPDEMKNFGEVDIVQWKWGDLGNLNKLKNLKELSISYQAGIDNLKFISSIPNLEKLIIVNSNLDDIQFVKSSPQLTYLDLSYNKIKSLNGIQGLTNLKHLNLSQNLINDVYHISNLTGLTNLYIAGNSVEDIVILGALVNLEEFSFNTDSSVNYEFLVNMKELRKLDAGNYSNSKLSIGNDGQDLSALSQLTAIEYLSLAGTGIKNVTPLSSLKNLKFLDLSYNDIIGEGLNSLDKLSNLETLNLEGNKIDGDISILANFKELKQLNLTSNSNITNFSALASNIKLETLVIKGVRLDDFSSISSLSELRYLDLSNNALENISLKNLHKLEYLNLERNNITDIPSISNLSNIEVIILKNNPIVDITALESAGNISIRILDLSNCRIKDASSFGSMKDLQFLNISNNNQLVNTSVFDNMTEITIIPINASKESLPSNLLSDYANRFKWVIK